MTTYTDYNYPSYSATQRPSVNTSYGLRTGTYHFPTTLTALAHQTLAQPRPVAAQQQQPGRQYQPIAHSETRFSTKTQFVAGDRFSVMNTARTNPPRHFASRKEMIDQEVSRRRQNGNAEKMKVSERGLSETGDGLDNSTKAITALGLNDAARPDIQHTISFGQGSPLKGQSFTANYRMVKNSTLNGATYDTPNGPHRVEESISSSLDRFTPHCTLARMMDLVDNTTTQTERVCYAARPDTVAKFKEMAQMAFLGERSVGKLQDKVPTSNYYKLNLVMKSFVSTSRFGEAEKELIDREKAALDQINHTLIDLHDENGQPVVVHCNILFYNRQFNFTNELEKALPSDLSGEDGSKEISDTIEDLEKWLTPEQKADPQIKACFDLLKNNRIKHNLDSLDELFLETLICELADIPILYHCRSCVDRTSIAVALAYAIRMWRKGNLRISQDRPHSIIDEETFKQLWYANIPPGLIMSSYSREACGFKWQTCPVPGFTMHPAVLRLMPEEHLVDFTLATFQAKQIKSVKNVAYNFFGRLLLVWKHPVSNIRNWVFGPTTIPIIGHIAKLLVVIAAWFIAHALFDIAIPLLLTIVLAAVLILSKKMRKKLEGIHPFLALQVILGLWNMIPTKIVKPDTKLFGEPVLFQGSGKPKYSVDKGLS